MCSFVFYYLSTTVAQLLFDVMKHAVAHFAPFLAPFLLALVFCVFKIIKFVDFFHIRKSYSSLYYSSLYFYMEKKYKKPSWKLLHKGAGYACYRFLFGKIQISFNHKETSLCTHFYGPPDFGGLAARLKRHYLQEREDFFIIFFINSLIDHWVRYCFFCYVPRARVYPILDFATHFIKLFVVARSCLSEDN